MLLERLKALTAYTIDLSRLSREADALASQIDAEVDAIATEYDIRITQFHPLFIGE